MLTGTKVVRDLVYHHAVNVHVHQVSKNSDSTAEAATYSLQLLSFHPYPRKDLIFTPMATIEPPQNGTATATNPLPLDNPSAAQPLTTDADTTAFINSSSIVNESAQETETVTETGIEPTVTPPEKRWSGWPGDCVFRLIVPVGKVGSIIGRKGELIKKLCEETKARVRVLDADLVTPDRVVSLNFVWS